MILCLSLVVVFLLPRTQGRVYGYDVEPSRAQPCPSGCECSLALALVNCSYQGLVELPIDIPQYVQELDLSNNALTKIPLKAFTGLASLTKLLLSSNKLAVGSIVNGSFSGVRKLDTLDLSYNLFSDVPEGLPENITYLYLIQNQLTALKTLGGGLKWVFHIDFSSNHISDVSKDVFINLPSVAVLYMSFNSISAERFPSTVLEPLTKLQIFEIRFNPLGEIPKNLPVSLVGLDLVGINLRNIPKGPLNHLKNLDNLAFWQNAITEIEDGAFVGLDKLTLMDGQSNKIRRITNTTFQGLPNIKTLYLDLNQITFIQPGAFNWFKQPRELWLASNNLTTLDSSFQEVLTTTSLTYVDISFNPWKCDCHLKWLKVLSERSSVIAYPHLIKCSSPPSLKNQPWDDLSAANFTC